MYDIIEPLEIRDENFIKLWLHPDIKDHYVPNSELNAHIATVLTAIGPDLSF